MATREAGDVATSAELKKSSKYKGLAGKHHVAPLAILDIGCFGPGAKFSSLNWADIYMTLVTGDPLA